MNLRREELSARYTFSTYCPQCHTAVTLEVDRRVPYAHYEFTERCANCAGKIHGGKKYWGVVINVEAGYVVSSRWTLHTKD